MVISIKQGSMIIDYIILLHNMVIHPYGQVLLESATQQKTKSQKRMPKLATNECLEINNVPTEKLFQYST